MVFYFIQICSILLCSTDLFVYCVFYGGFANSFLSPFLFGIFIDCRSGMRPKHEHTVDTLTAYLSQCCSLIFCALFFVQQIFVYIYHLSVCTGDRYALDCLIFRCYFRFDMVVFTEKKLLVMILIMYVVTILFILFLFSFTFAFIQTVRLSGLIIKMAYRF